ncbi:PucR family transcriptional regulator [Rhodococcus qingshengii]
MAARLTVGDLVAMKQLACEVLAGRGGLDRPIVWAHSCELKDPWNWVATDELLMTTGMCVPVGESDQEKFVVNLNSARVAGVLIGDDLQAPLLTPRMLYRADELNFPVISVAHATPFTAIGRTVAVAAQSDQIRRIARLSRLYEVARSSNSGDEKLLTRLSKELGHSLHVVDVDYGTEPLPTAAPLPQQVIRSLCEQVQKSASRLPVRVTVVTDGVLRATALALSTHRRCMLIAEGPSEVDLDAFVLLHAQGLVGIELERSTRERERSDRVEIDLFDQIVDGSIGADVAQPRLDQLGLTRQPWVVLCFDRRFASTCRTILGDHAIPKMTGEIEEEGYCVVSQVYMDTVTDLLAVSVEAMGASATTASLQRLSDCVRQARWALQAARANGGGVAEYSTAAPLFLPRTITEAQFATREILGDLLDYDMNNNSQLVATLETFLTLNRSWTAAAERLVIHRQTLAYRLKKIEEISGRSTKDSADIATLWMALIARRIAMNGSAR